MLAMDIRKQNCKQFRSADKIYCRNADNKTMYESNENVMRSLKQ